WRFESSCCCGSRKPASVLRRRPRTPVCAAPRKGVPQEFAPRCCRLLTGRCRWPLPSLVARQRYSCVVNKQLRAAHELANKIKKKKVGANGLFSCRDVYLKGWSGLDSPESVKAAAALLVDAGWLRESRNEPRQSGGRPSNRFAVNH